MVATWPPLALRAKRVIMSADAAGAAVAGDHTNHSAEEQTEDEDLRLARRRDGADHVFREDLEEAGDRVVVVHEGGGQPDTREQREDDLPEDERERDREERRQDAEEAGKTPGSGPPRSARRPWILKGLVPAASRRRPGR